MNTGHRTIVALLTVIAVLLALNLIATTSPAARPPLRPDGPRGPTRTDHPESKLLSVKPCAFTPLWYSEGTHTVACGAERPGTGIRSHRSCDPGRKEKGVAVPPLPLLRFAVQQTDSLVAPVAAVLHNPGDWQSLVGPTWHGRVTL